MERARRSETIRRIVGIALSKPFLHEESILKLKINVFF
jgi:hypothetical protein